MRKKPVTTAKSVTTERLAFAEYPSNRRRNTSRKDPRQKAGTSTTTLAIGMLMLAAHAMANHAPNTNTIAMDKTYDRTFTATPAPKR